MRQKAHQVTAQFRTERGEWMCYTKGWVYSFRKYSLGAYFVPDTVEGHIGED